MTILELCRRTYRDAIEAMELNGDLKRALKTHERVPAFIDNLAKEFTSAKGLKIKRDEVEKAVVDLTRWFVSAVTRHAEEKAMSQIARSMIKAQEKAKEDFKKEAESLEKKGADHVFETERGQVVRSVTEI